MTLHDFKRQNNGFYEFLGNFWLRDTFQKRIAPKAIKINMKKLHMKFSALNIDSGGLSLDFLGSRKSAHEDIKQRYSHKSRYYFYRC